MQEHYIFGDFTTADAPLSRSDLDEIFVKADRASGKILEIPVDKIIEILDTVACRWLDENYRLRKTAIERMAPIVGYSAKMTEKAIDTLFTTMRRENLVKIMRGHIGRASHLDGFDYSPGYEGYIKAEPLGKVLHVSPGNVFVGGVDSLMYGLLSKNVNLLKISRQDPIFPFLFAKSLKEVDEDESICNSFAILNFTGKTPEIEMIMKEKCDGIVVIGSEDAVRSYRKDLPLGTRLIEYGPKYSFSLITAEGFRQSDPDDVFTRCAEDVIIWEQRACSSPQVIYVESEIAPEFLEKFGDYMDKAAEKYRRENLDVNEKIEILKTAEMARFEEAEGTARLIQSKNNGWTIIYEQSPDFKVSPLNRTIYIKPFSAWSDILNQAVRYKDYLQTVGILATPSQMRTITKALSKLGVSRITRIGTMGIEKIGAPHDFDFPLRRLVKWVSIDWIEKRFDLGARVASERKILTYWDNVRDVIRFAREHSDFYRERFKDVDVKSINSFESFTGQVPLLDRRHIYANTPPVGEGLLTAPLSQAYVFASGGSTGEPKFIFYNFSELDNVSSILADIYQIAGVTNDDIVANLFMAGFLWTSFIAVNDALEKIGCVTLPIAGNADLDLIIQYMTLFRPTAIVGLPSMIIRLAEEIQQNGLDIRVEKILYGGEHFSDEAIKFLKESFGAEIIHSAGYASVDAGPIGYQCPENKGGVHHLLNEYVFFEVVDPATGKPLQRGQTGEIVITNFKRRLMPIIRYRTGDLGRIIETPCECGRKTPLFELLGRTDDILRIGAMSIYPDRIAEALGKVEELAPLFRMEADYDGVKETLTIKVESTSEDADFKSLEGRTKKALLSSDPELDLVVRESWLGTLNVEILPPGGLPRNPRTGKVKTVVDNRTRTGA